MNENEQITEKNNSDQTTLPLGHVFEQARKDASLSIKDVAERLNLSKSIIRDLEGDIDWLIKSKKYTPLYFRGYISNYASLLSLKSIDSFPEFQKLIEVNRASIAPNAASTILLQSNKKKPLFIILSLSVLLTGALVYLGSSYFFNDEMATETKIETIYSDDGSLENPPVINDTSLEIEKKTEKKSDLIEDVKNEVISIKDEITKKFETDKKAPEPIAEPVAELKVEKVIVEPKVEPKVIEKKVAKVIEKKVALEQSTAVQNKAEEIKVAQKIETLSLQFKDNCWTEIKDSTGKRLAFNLYKDGDKLALAGIPPFKISLGNPTEVSVRYQGKEIYNEFKKGTTAHFTIPK